MCNFDGPDGNNNDVCGSYHTLKAPQPNSNYKNQLNFDNYQPNKTYNR